MVDEETPAVATQKQIADTLDQAEPENVDDLSYAGEDDEGYF